MSLDAKLNTPAERLEEDVYAALDKIFALGDETSLDIVRNISCQLAAYVADVSAVGQQQTLRMAALARLHHIQCETDTLIRQIEGMPCNAVKPAMMI